MLGQLIREKVESGRYILRDGENIIISEEEFRSLIKECQKRFSGGFIKTYREMMTEEFYREISASLINLELAEKRREDVLIRPAVGRVIGRYPTDFNGNGVQS